MTRKNRLLSAVALSATLAITAAACSSDDSSSESSADGQEMLEVNFGYIPDFNGASLLAVAESEGYWEAHGVDVNTQVFTNGPLQIQALGTGDLDFGNIGPGAFWLPASGQAQLVAMNALGQNDRVVAQPGINSMDDLRGKTVAVPVGTSGDMILTLALEDAGMAKDDIELVPMEPSAIVAAMSSGQVDAAGFWYPALATVSEQVPDMVELAQNSDFEDTVAFPNAFVAGNDVVADDPEMTDRVLGALRDAMEFRAANMEETIQLTADYTNQPVEAVTEDSGMVRALSAEEVDELTEDGSVESWLNGMQDYFVEAEKIDEKVDPNSFYAGDLFIQAGE
ncbi:aliphatic sulfonate ABC transporter substrate-binding protein [Ornithinimicrobium sp. Arc0846-15]|nr:aliphatic sulfonate ABC transporter substrate-binding protein [Ornithinimicrobium laminariae]